MFVSQQPDGQRRILVRPRGLRATWMRVTRTYATDVSQPSRMTEMKEALDWEVEAGGCGDPECYVLHTDPTNPIHPPWYVDSRTVLNAESRDEADATAQRSPKRRLRACVEAWPEAETMGYDPRCCRFPKSCSATVYDEQYVSEADLEPSDETHASAGLPPSTDTAQEG